MSIKDGGPAFPAFRSEKVYHGESDRVGSYEFLPQGGMSLRDWFAGQAIAAVIAFVGRSLDAHDALSTEGVARQVYGIADAMLKAREAK